MRNLELKVRDPDPAATVAACERLGAQRAGVLRQRDTYFAVSVGRLKLREEDGSAELVWYERPLEAGVRESRYERVPVSADTAGLLRRVLPVVDVVEKTRVLYLHRHVRIHLDEVAGLGSFVELEAVEPPPGDGTLEEVIRALGLDAREPIAGGYLELSRA